MKITLRPAGLEDERLLFDWVNDPGVREMARNRSPIDWNEHRAWFAEKLAAETCRIWIAESAGKPVGQIRLDRHGERVEVDISVDPKWRGYGIGSKMLMSSQLAVWPTVTHIEAAIRRGNDASVSTFRRAGFKECGSDDGFVYFEKVICDAVTG